MTEKRKDGGIRIGGTVYGELPDDDPDDLAAAVRLLAENEKSSHFRDKRSMELEKVQKLAHHTRTKIRVKFPDGYILQGTFGAKEKLGDVITFIQE